jgi:hypothetical protein
MSDAEPGPAGPLDASTGEALEITALVAGHLKRLGVACCIGGSLASSLHGIPRSTQDADLAAALRPEHVEPLVAALDESFYVARERILDAIRRQASFNVIHLETLFKVDVFCVGDDLYSRTELERCEPFAIAPDRVLQVASAEDTILQKLLWYRRGGEVSDRQWEDLIGVLDVQGPRLDTEYLRRWAKELGLSDLLERASRQTELDLDTE